MQIRDLYIIGAGGFGREVAWLAERINAVEPTWNIKGFVDDSEAIQGTKLGNYAVVGTCQMLREMGTEVWVICAIGPSCVRRQVIEKVSYYDNVKFATLIDPSVLMSSSVQIGEGSMVCSWK